jgi:RNA recognition motif-containing protein
MSDRTIYITGLSPIATEKDLKDLFSFCGNLLRITIRSGGGDTNEALIEFDAASALDMALQFSNALVKGKTIMVFPYSESPESKLGLDQKKQSTLPQNSPKSSPVGSPPSSLSMSPPKSTTIPSPDSGSAPKTNPTPAMLVEPKKVSKSIIDEDVFNFDDLPPKSTEFSPPRNAAQGDDLSTKNTNEQPSSPNSSNYNSMSPSTLSPRDSLNFERLSLVR